MNDGRKGFTFRLDEELYKKFSDICDKIGLIRSRKIETLMRDFVEKRTAYSLDEMEEGTKKEELKGITNGLINN